MKRKLQKEKVIIGKKKKKRKGSSSLTLAGIVGAVVVAGNDVGILRALAAVVITAAQGEPAVLGAEAGLDNVGGGADGGGLGRGNGEHGGEGEESGLHFGGWVGLDELGCLRIKTEQQQTKEDED